MVLMIEFNALEKSARDRHIPVIFKEGITFIIAELKARHAHSLLEIGSAIGYSAMMMAANCEDLHIETIERNDDLYQEAKRHIQEASLEDRITLYHDDALSFDPQLLKGAPYDVLFIDAAKAQYRKFFEKYIDLVKDDGVVIVDNLDFHGMLEHPETIGNRNTKALVRKIERFRKWIVENDDYHVDYIPVGDGLCTITKAKHKLKLALHLNDASYLHDYLEMGVDRLIVAGPMSAYSSHKFSLEEIEAISARVPETYVMVNGLYDEHELPALRRLIDAYAKMNIKGLLFQDFGVLHYVKNRYDFRMMYAPNTLNTNYMTLNVLEDLGVDSAWVAKEIPLEEQIAIKKHTHLPIMIQGHGVQYMMSSKRHLLKSYAKAAHKEFNQDNVILHARESDYATHIYEDERGTTIFSVNKLYTLDLLNEMSVFDYLYIETNYMSAIEAIEVTHMYSECLKALNEVGVQEYVHKMKDYLPMLREISKPLDRGFLNDETLYRLEDVKRRDNHGAM